MFWLNGSQGVLDSMQAINGAGGSLYARVGEWRGSISAEHGIGSLKRPYLHHSRTPAELALMDTLKQALDPRDTLHPGKVMWNF